LVGKEHNVTVATLAPNAPFASPAPSRDRSIENGRQAVSNSREGVRDRGLDDAWFVDFYDEHFDSVYRYAGMLVRNTQLAEDVVSDAFLRAWEARHTCRNRDAALSWILSITRNCAIDALRAQKKGTVELSAIPEPEDPGPDLSPQEPTLELRMRLEEAIRELPPEQQQVLFMRFYEKRSHDEVAQQLGKNASAVRVIQFRALGRLRKLMDGVEATNG
jgi:RNA polymerase sigma-70 factor, ECF subfamily